jgi:hypothetical protein
MVVCLATIRSPGADLPRGTQPLNMDIDTMPTAICQSSMHDPKVAIVQLRT